MKDLLRAVLPRATGRVLLAGALAAALPACQQQRLERLEAIQRQQAQELAELKQQLAEKEEEVAQLEDCVDDLESAVYDDDSTEEPAEDPGAHPLQL